MQPLIEHRLQVDGFSTRVLELEGGLPAFVLLHGWADSADGWRPLLELLARSGRAALAVDLPAFGAASPLGPGAVLPQLDAFAGALVERVAADTGAPVVAVGNSLGGVVVLRLAERADLALAGVVPVAPAGLDMPRWFEIVERDPLVRTLLAMPVPIPRAVLARTIGEVYRRLAFSSPERADPQVVATFAAHHAHRLGARRLLANGRRLLPELVRRPFDFERVCHPVLLVWGTRDRMVPHSGHRLVLEALGAREGFRLQLLEGVGHCPQLEATGELLDLLLDFAPESAVRAA